jgi:hypothetical protein
MSNKLLENNRAPNLENNRTPNLEINKSVNTVSTPTPAINKPYVGKALLNALLHPKIHTYSVILYKKTSSGSELGLYANDITNFKTAEVTCIYPMVKHLSYRFNRQNNILTIPLPSDLQHKSLILNINVKKPNNLKVLYKASYSP